MSTDRESYDFFQNWIGYFGEFAIEVHLDRQPWNNRGNTIKI